MKEVPASRCFAVTFSVKRIPRRLFLKVSVIICLCLSIVSIALNHLYFAWTNSSTNRHITQSNGSEKPCSESKPNAFYVETSHRALINPRQACSLESLAFHNPDLTIHVLMTSENSKTEGFDYLAAIQEKYGNIAREKLDLDDYFYGTPLEQWFHFSNWTEGPYKVAHLSDALRFLILWKYGGYYFDFDLIHLRSVTRYKNFVALEDKDYAGSAALHADRSHPLFTDILEEFNQTYRAKDWAYNGPGCLTRTLKRYCNQADTVKLNYITCGGFNIFPYLSFYPVYWVYAHELFHTHPTYNLSSAGWLRDETLAIHVWNSMTHHMPVRKSSSQLYVQLAKSHCPLTLKAAPDIF